MPYNPYTSYGSIDEYNVRGDSANGRTGSYTNEALANRQTQQGGAAGKNPYGDILGYLPNANLPGTGPGRTPQVPGQPQTPQVPGTLPGTGPGQPVVPTQPAPTAPQTGFQAPPQPQPVPVTPQDGFGARTQSHRDSPTWMNSDEGRAARSDPAEAARQYNLLAPDVFGGQLTQADVENFRNWELQRLATGAQPTRIEDWWKNGKPLPYFGDRSDPSLRSSGGGVSNEPSAYPQGYEGAGQPPTAPTLPTAPTNPAGTGPAPGEGPVAGPDPGAPVPGAPGGTDTPAPEWWTDYNPSADDALRMATDLYNPLFERQANDFTKRMRASAALTGQQDSGGFGANLSEGLSALSADQGKVLGDKAFDAHQSALDRAMARYGVNVGGQMQLKQIDAQKFIAQLQDDTARFGITTNDQLQRYLQENELEMQKYGIDVQDLWQRYQADLQLKGVQIGASAQIQAASLQAAAAGAAAAANAAAAKYDADVRLKLGMENLSFDRDRFGQQQQWEQYQYNNPSFWQILDLYTRFSPEAMAQQGAGSVPFPSFGYRP